MRQITGSGNRDLSHPNEVAQLILNAANNATRGEKVAQ